MALNSEVPAVDVRVIRVRDLDQSEERKQLQTNRKVVAGIKSAISTQATTATLTVTQVLNGFITTAGGTTPTLTFPTAANMVAALPGAAVGDTFMVFLENVASGSATIAAGGATLVGNATVPTAKSALIIGTLTNVTAAAEAYTIYSIVGA